MSGPNPTNPADQLPKDAPADLRDFLSCKSATYTLKNGKLSWLQLSSIVDGVNPTLSVQPGSTPGTANLTLSLGPFVSISIPASITNGQLSLDTSGLPTQGMQDGVQASIQNLNNWFTANKNQFGPATFGPAGLSLTKVPLATASATPPPPAMVKITTVSIPGAATTEELFNVPSQDPPQSTSGPSGGSIGTPFVMPTLSVTGTPPTGSTPQAKTVTGDSVGSVHTATPSGINRLAPPDSYTGDTSTLPTNDATSPTEGGDEQAGEVDAAGQSSSPSTPSANAIPQTSGESHFPLYDKDTLDALHPDATPLNVDPPAISAVDGIEFDPSDLNGAVGGETELTPLPPGFNEQGTTAVPDDVVFSVPDGGHVVEAGPSDPETGRTEPVAPNEPTASAPSTPSGTGVPSTGDGQVHRENTDQELEDLRRYSENRFGFGQVQRENTDQELEDLRRYSENRFGFGQVEAADDDREEQLAPPAPGEAATLPINVASAPDDEAESAEESEDVEGSAPTETAVAATPAAASAETARIPVIVGIVVVAAGLLVAFLLFGKSAIGGPSPTATPSPRVGGPTTTSQPSTAPASQLPAFTQGPPPAFVIISVNEPSIGQSGNFDPYTFCHKGGQVTYTFKFAGIAPNTPVVVQLSGPSVPSSLTFTASPNVPFAKSYDVGPGGGTWSDQIVTIGGNPPPSSGSQASAPAQC